MNPRLSQLQPYPFYRLRTLLVGATPPAEQPHINLSIGEPQHPTPDLVKQALINSLDGLSQYPSTQGGEALRQACARWMWRRYNLNLDPQSEILPVNGSREALFSFVQTVIDATANPPQVVVSPNPFYQVYEGAALLAGASLYYVNCLSENHFQPDWRKVPDTVWRQTKLVIVCSPGNPTGSVMSLTHWSILFQLSDRYGFFIASDECYSEIYLGQPPLGGLEAAKKLGRSFSRLIMFTSLSKRSNAPGMRSGFVAGDPAILKNFLLYRTYHGSAMSSAIQAASMAAWNDDDHVKSNRAQYIEKLNAVTERLATVLEFQRPEAGFYLWARVPDGDDVDFTLALFSEAHVTVLPGSYLSREAHGVNPGAGYIRLALVASKEECVTGVERIVAFTQRRQHKPT